VAANIPFRFRCSEAGSVNRCFESIRQVVAKIKN